MPLSTDATPTDDKEYRQLKQKARELEEKLYTYFLPEVKKLYEDTRWAQLDAEAHLECRLFKKTFAFGALLMHEVMCEGRPES